ncbi:MAG: DUF4132 domain-containing protein [Clostridia bacterium]|nr:DUF4132 domain-containing protein [Clostridia bacterium]
MTFLQMTEALPDKDSPADAVGREFFSPQTSESDRKKLLEFLLKDERYEQLFRLICCGHINGTINMKSSGADYAAMTGETSTIYMRYFSLFVRTALDCGVREEQFLPLLFAAVTSGKKNVLRVWKAPSEQYLIKRAKDDYERTRKYLAEHDPDFKSIHILLRADEERTVADLTELAVLGRGINKVAIRNVLRPYKKEVFTYVRPLYGTLKNDDKLSALRLLLLFKNDPEVGAYLRALASTEKSKSVCKLLGGKAGTLPKEPRKTDRKQLIAYFQDAMVFGTSVSAERFISEWIRPPYAEIADSLFFSVYVSGRLQDIVIVDAERVLDIENRPYTFPADCEIKVLHPVELTAKTEFLTRLNITQPFAQIKRKVYLPNAEDKRSNACLGVSGTVVTAGAFTAGMRKIGFRILNRDRDGVCSQLGLRRDGVLCVLNVAPIDFASASADRAVQAQCVRFYAEKDAVRLGGQTYVQGVAPLSVASMDARMFSEFMYSVYELTGCR